MSEVIYILLVLLFIKLKEERIINTVITNQLKDTIAGFGENANYNIQRFKGLGEMMPKQLWDTTTNPQSRMMKRVGEDVEADRIFNILMGDKVAPRREFIETHSANLDLASLDI